MKRYLIVTFLLTFVALPALAATAPTVCTVETPATACTTSQMDEAPASLIMCFDSLDVTSDLGATWDSVFSAESGIQIDVMDLGGGADISSVDGVTMGSLQKNTSYPCARANVSAIVFTSTGEEVCDAKATLEGEGMDASAMYMRGSDDCPGDASHPPTIPFITGTEGPVFKFNITMGQSGSPEFILYPVSGAELDVSVGAELLLTATGAGDNDGKTLYCGLFTYDITSSGSSGSQSISTSLSKSQGVGPDAGGTSGTISGGSGSCIIPTKVGSLYYIAFVDVDSSGTTTGPNEGDLVCTGEITTVAGNEELNSVECTLSAYDGGSGGGSCPIPDSCTTDCADFECDGPPSSQACGLCLCNACEADDSEPICQYMEESECP